MNQVVWISKIKQLQCGGRERVDKALLDFESQCLLEHMSIQTIIHNVIFTFTGVLRQNGAHWKTLRLFTLRALHGEIFAGGENQRRSSSRVLADFNTKTGSPFNPGKLFDKAISNIICSIIFGQRFWSLWLSCMIDF